ncbi:MAG TPA: DUF882 domain-containing protein [Devosia sp.]|nr:DUF882 domain-containing protein [Devosia sp.]
MALVLLLPPTALPVNAEMGDRTLYLYHTHTHETARITFKRNGVYDAKGLQQLDWFLRDWRNNQPTQMAPQLFDLVWEIYQKSGATQPINIVSAYRSPVTNAYLHSHSAGVANNSQHMLGHAMDFFIPGVPLTRLRQVAMQQQVGGVGFYPTSGSPFVHVDVGTVRAWPRMTQAQLQAIFPDGKTLHVPTDGKVLSQAGYAYAEAQWNQCHAVPCSNPAALQGGAAALGRTTMVAVATTSATGKTFADIHAGVNPGDPSIRNPGAYVPPAGDEEELADAREPAGPQETAVATIAVAAPVPLPRPAGLEPVGRTASVDDPTLIAAAQVPFDKLFPSAYDDAAPPPAGKPAAPTEPVPLAPLPPSEAPIPAHKSYDMMVATGEFDRSGKPQNAVAAIASIEEPPAPGGSDAALGYAAAAPAGVAESQLQAIIENETTGAIGARPGGTALTNSVGSPLGADALKSYAALRRSHQNMPPPLTAKFAIREARLVAPGLDGALIAPVAMTSAGFAVFTMPAARDISPATELGAMVAHVSFRPQTASVGDAGFVRTSLLVASR